MIIVLTLILSLNLNLHEVSFYSDPFHGRQTANGEVYDKNKLTCAALKHYKFRDRLKVTNLKNNKSVIVTVNDRGNFKKYGRTLDLSEAAFKKIGNLKKGVLTVKIEKL
jgi:rare lipoprotein A